MIIDNRLFGESWCPTNGIGRVCLNGIPELIPQELTDIGLKEDGKDNYDPGCFSIDIIIKNGNAVAGMINYMGEDRFIDCYVCDNYKEAWDYYLKHATKEDIVDAMKGD